MELESFTRRELQALCKKNKIPANITNIAMIEALKALDFIEGIEEFQQASQSDTAESSINSPEKLEVTTPAVPRTGGRTTRRRTVPEPETLVAATRTKRTARKTVVDATETPAVVQTARNKASISVCRKMDAQLKECADEEKRNDVLVTPAPSGVTARRRGAVNEETVVTTRAYSTRRSVRLTAKNAEVEKEKSDLITKDDGEFAKINLKKGLDAMDETSGLTGSEENVEKKDEAGVVSVEQSEEAGAENSLVTIDDKEEKLEGKDESAVQEQDMLIGNKTEPMPNVEEDFDLTCYASRTEMEMDEVNLVVQETNGSQDVGDDSVDPKLEVKEDNNNLENDKIFFSSKTEMEMDDENSIVELEIPNVEISLKNEVQETNGSQDVEVSETEVTDYMKTDNKENTGSYLTKEEVKISDKAENEKLDDLSLRKLCKMLKQKLEITKKLPKCEIGEAVHARTALQIIPENRMVNEN